MSENADEQLAVAQHGGAAWRRSVPVSLHMLLSSLQEPDETLEMYKTQRLTFCLLCARRHVVCLGRAASLHLTISLKYREKTLSSLVVGR